MAQIIFYFQLIQFGSKLNMNFSNLLDQSFRFAGMKKKYSPMEVIVNTCRKCCCSQNCDIRRCHKANISSIHKCPKYESWITLVYEPNEIGNKPNVYYRFDVWLNACTLSLRRIAIARNFFSIWDGRHFFIFS